MTIVAQAIQKALALTKPNAHRGAASGDPRHRVLISPAGAGLLELICADDTTETSVRIPGSVEAGIALAPQFCDLVQTLAADVNIKLAPNGKGACKVQTGRSRFSVPSAPPEDFPRFQDEAQEEVVGVSIGATALGKALQAVRCGLGKPDPAKPFTSGILVKATPNGVYLASTNGFKLVVVSLAGSTGENGKTAEGVIPEMGIAQIERLARSIDGEDATVEIRIGARHALAAAGQAVIRSRLIACKFPDYARVTLVSNPATVAVSRTALVAILKRVGLFVTEGSPFVTVKVEAGKLSCSVKTAAGECTETMDIEPGNSQALEHHINISFLCSMLEAMPGDVVNLDFAASLLRVRGTGQNHNAVAVAAYYKA